MKIVVTQVNRKNGKKTYDIEVIDGESVMHSETVQGLQSRDRVVWDLADTYGVVDIEMREDKEAEFKFTEIPSIPVLEEEEASDFFEDNNDFVYDRLIQAVSEGIRSGRDSIRLFELNGTGVFMTSNKADWQKGVQQALDYFEVIEDYDKCIVARQLLIDLA
jgi:hypothetical protein